MSFGKLGALGKGFGKLGGLAGAGGPVLLPFLGGVAKGDSLTSGGYGETLSYPARLAIRSGFNIINRGQGGQKLLAMDVGFATEVAPYYNAANANTLFMLGGTNDLFASETFANLQAAEQSIAAKAFAIFKKNVFWGTVPPSSFITGGGETVRGQFNTFIRAQFPGQCFDFAAISEWSNPANTEYVIDGTHPTDKLIMKMVDVVMAALGLTDLLVTPAWVSPAMGGSATFANGNTRATLTTAKATVRANTPIKGKKIISSKLITDGGFVTGVGFTNVYAGPTETIGQDAFRSVAYFGNGTIYMNNGSSNGAPTYTTGAWIDQVIDETNARAWWTLDGVTYYGTGGVARSVSDVTNNIGGFDWSSVKANGAVYPAAGQIITAGSVHDTAAPRTIIPGYSRVTV